MNAGLLLIVLACCVFAQQPAQTPPAPPVPAATPAAFDAWVDGQIAAILSEQTIAQNQQGADKQKQSPSATSRSTALVDQSSSADFLSVAMSLAPVASATPAAGSAASSGTSTTMTSTASSSTASSGAGTVTSTLYGILVGINGVAPTNPSFYQNHVDARRLSFTIGTAQSTAAIDNTTALAKVFGAKLLLLNGRELYTKKNLAAIRMVQTALARASAASATLKPRLLQMIFADLHKNAVTTNPDGSPTDAYVKFLTMEVDEANFANTIRELSPAASNEIKQLLTVNIAPFTNLNKQLDDTYDSIQQGRQLSVAYTANIRPGNGHNDHVGQILFDYGLSPRINWTFNADGNYTDKKGMKDVYGGTAATQFTGNLTKPNASWSRFPVTLSFSGSARWLTSIKPQYAFQAALTIPVSPGIDVPISYRYANKAAELNQTPSQAALGLTIDISRLTQSVK